MNNQPKALPPSILVIFGITGDLARKKLLPALRHLYREKILPKQFAVIGFSRRDWSDARFQEEILKTLHLSKKSADDKSFLKLFKFQGGFFDDKKSYKSLSDKIDKIHEHWKSCTNIIFHLAVPPSYYPIILEHLAHHRLTTKCSPKEGWSRILVEKPFGNDYETARKLDEHLGKQFKEAQIFRVDHYLAKETIQNILTFRFSNSIFEPIWNKKYIEKVEIKMLESGDIDGRGEYYDAYGALRDVGQNHILQMLALITMESPKELKGDQIRQKRAGAVESLEIISKKDLLIKTVRGQYQGYRNEPEVRPASQTETFFKIQAALKNQRWSGVPFYLEAGKALYESKTEIKVHFKESNNCFCPADQAHIKHANVLSFAIQPQEKISIQFWAKKPGLTYAIEPRNLSFRYKKDFFSLSGYEKLLFDAIIGDQTLFASTKEVMAAWRFITPIVRYWHNLPLHIYKKGSRESDVSKNS